MENNRERGSECSNVFVPIGSILVVKGNTKKLMILARGVITKIDKTMHYFDYGACAYPEGIEGDSVLYFNRSDIEKIVSLGYSDEEEMHIKEQLEEHVKVFKCRADAMNQEEAVR